ncbi:MAG: histidine--tRNA ligase [Bacteroidia bacterium]|nr:histidine--tRNA ligase [Bacteroidia bacterium]
MQKAALPKGTRDFSPEVMKRRKFITTTIESVYKKFGFDPIETPAMEKLSTLTGKYGDEGDTLLFKVLDSGDFLAKADQEALNNKDSNKLIPSVASKGLRYDLTVPFARYVVQNQTHITFPFRRYQMQPVWRADRPQKGRYREFWQCDADVIGTKSLLCEADFIKIYHEVFSTLGLGNYELRLNHRKALEAIAKTCGFEGSFTALTVAIDKLDKIGWEGVSNELLSKGMDHSGVETLKQLLNKVDFDQQALDLLSKILTDSKEKDIAIEELSTVLGFIRSTGIRLKLDLSLARGLDYYTGCIFEATIPGSGIGSVSGGGRYDDLTGIFGLKDVSGVGISFGLDRIYDVMLAADLFKEVEQETKVLFCHFDESALLYGINLADKLREAGIASVVYSDRKKINKQFDYAHKCNFPYVAVIGDDEMANGVVQLKNMATGKQEKLTVTDLIERLK